MPRFARPLLLGCLAFGSAHAVDHNDPGGIWKAVVPPKTMRGEFNNEDPVGLAAGKHIPTDCSMNWVGDDGKLYCFTTGTSLVFFEQSPESYIRAAHAFFDYDRPHP